MPFISFFRPGLVKSSAVYAVSTWLFFSGFYSNSFRVAGDEWFAFQNRDMEGHVLARLVKSRQDGLFSAGGLIGLGNVAAAPVSYWDRPFESQYAAYLEGLKFSYYLPYKSQNGGQGFIFSLLDRSISIDSRSKLRAFHFLTALLSALALAAVVLWFFIEFGLWVSLFAMASVALSQWMVVFGRNLFWSLWAFYVPMLAVMYFLRSRPMDAPCRARLALIVFTATLIKCLMNGYEYITAAVLMMMCPVLYYGIARGWAGRPFMKTSVSAMLAAAGAILLSVTILLVQVGSAVGKPAAGMHHVFDVFERRTYPEPERFGREHGEELKSAPNPNRVVLKYFAGEDAGVARGTFFDFNNYMNSRWYISGVLAAVSSISKSYVPEYIFKIRYFYLMIVFLFASAYLLLRNRPFGGDDLRLKHLALVATTWGSLLAPLSWFYIFNQHAYIHTQMDFIVWQMPFTIFGFAVCGAAARVFVRGLLNLGRIPDNE
jgi:hypothetical protein